MIWVIKRVADAGRRTPAAASAHRVQAVTPGSACVWLGSDYAEGPPGRLYRRRPRPGRYPARTVQLCVALLSRSDSVAASGNRGRFLINGTNIRLGRNARPRVLSFSLEELPRSNRSGLRCSQGTDCAKASGMASRAM